MRNVIREVINKYKAKREALKLAGMAFQADYPEKELHVGIGKVKYDEKDRYVVEVRYGHTRPSDVAFYAVDKSTKKAYLVKDKRYKRTYIR
jgi:hypothetical protein